ncbi:substrate-binding domain-containing protein [Vreelandella populi]|uniref:LacI family DNA-binding transcriptional regulator n=1 Tax=Vreelandella populi TaxID=2498858 RepID=A0A3S1E713_9GAMM|nr:substrate-binding domain-containing protein [Halomonas populi]RUR42448.1 LacI family DNA-binding transcriptional regulator [Halomonas populi]RUR45947.1 LacI family DNA-binding transcriptional regulator [Halomonas populi]
MSAASSRATLIEVAKLAGTSKTSVSRFFGPERERLTPSLQTRIANAATALGYQPNLMARGLKGGGSRLLGVLVADIRNPFSVAVVHGIEQAARTHGYSLIVCNTDNDPEQEQQHLRLLKSYQIEGLIINAAGQPEAQLQALKHSGVPLVLLDREVRQLDVDVIGLDNALAIDMALDHLVRQGYRSILYASEPPAYASTRQERLQRFNQQAERLGIKSQTLILSSSAPDFETLTAFVEHPGSSPGAVLCANGNVTLAMTRSFQQLDITLGQTGLMGIDELDWCELITPGITTLAQPTDDIGHAAVSCLLNQLNGSAQASPVRYRHAPRLQIRGSTTLVPNF